MTTLTLGLTPATIDRVAAILADHRAAGLYANHVSITSGYVSVSSAAVMTCYGNVTTIDWSDGRGAVEHLAASATHLDLASAVAAAQDEGRRAAAKRAEQDAAFAALAASEAPHD